MSFSGEDRKSRENTKWLCVILAIVLSLIFISLSNVANAQTREDDKDALFNEIISPLQNEKIKVCIACVWKHTQHVTPKTEAAAWVLREADGGYNCLYWPVNSSTKNNTPDAVASLTWRGIIPPNMVAIIHSHPNGADRYPSSGDKDVVKKLAVPNYVVSQYGVTGSLWWLQLKDDGEVKAKVSNVNVYGGGDLDKMSKLLNSENCPDKMPDHMMWKINPLTDER